MRRKEGRRVREKKAALVVAEEPVELAEVGAMRDEPVGSTLAVAWAEGGGANASEWIPRLKAGLPVRELDALREALGVSMERLAPLLGISRATLHRRLVAGRLDSAESDRVVRFARLLGRASEVFESLPNGRLWLQSPQWGIGGAIPLEYAETEVGAREVEDLLGRIEFGVYS